MGKEELYNPIYHQIYWRHKLHGADSVMEMPLDFLCSGSRPRKMLQFTYSLPTSTVSGIRKLAGSSELSTYIVLLSGIKILISKYTGKKDILISTCPYLTKTIKHRVPVRTLIKEDMIIKEVLLAVKSSVTEAYAHQQYDTYELVEQPDITILFENIHYGPYPDNGDLTFSFKDDSEHVNCKIAFNQNLYKKDMVEQISKHYMYLMSLLPNHLNTVVSAISLVSVEEKNCLLNVFNAKQADYPVDMPLSVLFERQVEAASDRVAAIHGDEQVTYAQLNKKANQIARHLRQLGIKPNDFVGLLDCRGIDFLTVLMGILKAGGAYLPISPYYPEKRILSLLTDSRTAVLVTRSSMLNKHSKLKSLEDLRSILCLDNEPKLRNDEGISVPIHYYLDIATLDGSDLDAVNKSTDIAYLLYTSGSTGTPKGVMIRHNGAINHIYGEFDELAFHEDICFLQSAPCSSDISVWQLIAPLLIGGKTVIIDRDQVIVSSDLFEIIKSRQVTIIELVPVILKALISYIASLSQSNRALTSLEWAMVTGEAVSPALVNEWFQICPNVKLVNAYGPTEASDDVCQCVLEKPISTFLRNVPIGKPIANLSLHVLDSEMNLCPIGVPGEICISGIGVAQGYWGNEELTQLSFVENPFCKNRYDSMLYHTGDRGRYLPDGTLEFLGRLDNQVKVGGYRIELGEIENVLNKCLGVQQSAVIVRQDNTQEKRLVAYYVREPGYHPHEMERAKENWDTKRIQQWQVVYDGVYSQNTNSRRDPLVNYRIWVNSYTNAPYHEKDIFECVEDTVHRIKELNPRRILEIGCGTGLLLSRISPICSYYCGTDLSKEPLKVLQEQIAKERGKYSKISLLHRPADDFSGFSQNDFDLVIINEVIQYFPAIDYLMNVLQNAVSVVKAGGNIYIGGVRNLNLLKLFHISVQIYQSPSCLSIIQLRERIQKQLSQDKELLVDPQFFYALQGYIPRISNVKIQLKGGACLNEITKFKYDVLLQVESGSEPLMEYPCIDWPQKRLTFESVQALLHEQRPEILCVHDVPNSRVIEDVKVSQLFSEEGRLETVGQLKAEVQKVLAEEPGVDPDKWWKLKSELPYHVDIYWANPGAEGRYDILFTKCSYQKACPDRFPSQMRKPLIHRPWQQYGNDPLCTEKADNLNLKLREYSERELPYYMVPSAFVQLDSLPMTVNGKLDRKVLPVLDIIRPELEDNYVAPTTKAEEVLAGIWSDILGVKPIGIKDNFFELGGDSILSIQIISRANQSGLRLTPKQLFEYQSIESLARVADIVQLVHSEQEMVIGSVPLTSIQHWFFEQNLLNPNHFNQSVMLELKHPINPLMLEQAIEGLLLHHDALRMRFYMESSSWKQKCQGVESEVVFDVVDVSEPIQKPDKVVLSMCNRIQAGLDISSGPLVRGALFILGEDEIWRLLVVIHHLVVDGVSWRILLEDLGKLYSTLCAGLPMNLPPKTTSFKDWAKDMMTYSCSKALLDESEYWTSLVKRQIEPLPVDYVEGRNTVSSFESVSVSLSNTETDLLLRDIPRVYNTQINDVLLTSLVKSFYFWTGRPYLYFDLEGHGREVLSDRLDVSRTVGWFTAVCPVFLKLCTDGGPGEELKSVKEQMRSIPNQGIGHCILRYLSSRDEVTAPLKSAPSPEVIFNYLGRFDQTSSSSSFYQLSWGKGGDEQAPENERSHLLSINGVVLGGCLQMDFGYSRNVHTQSTIADLAKDFLKVLKSLLNHCQSVESQVYTPSDFPLAKLDNRKLKSILDRVKFKKEVETNS